MPCMYTFAFYFSVRLGSIIVAAVTLLENTAVMIACGVEVNRSGYVSDSISDWLLSHKYSSMEDLITAVKHDPETFFKVVLALVGIHTGACILLIPGALRLALWMLYPFAVLEGCRLVLLMYAFVAAMLVVREDVSSLGVITAASVAGTFTMLLLFYMWFCTISLCQTVVEVNKINEVTKLLISATKSHGDRHKQTAAINVGYFSDDVVPPVADLHYPR